MPGGKLPRIDSELVILRVAHNCNSEYEWGHHERLGALAGLSKQAIAEVRDSAGGEEFTPRQRLLLRAADELHEQRTITDELWPKLRAELSDRDLIELFLLVGHYEMLAMTLNALRVQPDPIGGRTPVVMRLLQRATRR